MTARTLLAAAILATLAAMCILTGLLLAPIVGALAAIPTAAVAVAVLAVTLGHGIVLPIE